MGNDELSGEEIDDLLDSIMSETEALPAETVPDGPVVRIYDFLRPQIITSSAYNAFDNTLNQQIKKAAERISVISGNPASASVISVDMLTLEELSRTMPNPCFGVTANLSSGKRFYLEYTSSAAAEICSVFAGLSGAGNGPAEWNRTYANLLPGITEYLLQELSGTAGFSAFSEPSAVISEFSFEPVIAVSITPFFNNIEKGRINLSVPLSTAVELFPEAFSAFSVSDPPESKFASPGEDTPEYDLWFRRIIRFPVYNADLGNMAKALKEGVINLSDDISGRIIYESE